MRLSILWCERMLTRKAGLEVGALFSKLVELAATVPRWMLFKSIGDVLVYAIDQTHCNVPATSTAGPLDNAAVDLKYLDISAYKPFV